MTETNNQSHNCIDICKCIDNFKGTLGPTGIAGKMGFPIKWRQCLHMVNSDVNHLVKQTNVFYIQGIHTLKISEIKGSIQLELPSFVIRHIACFEIDPYNFFSKILISVLWHKINF